MAIVLEAKGVSKSYRVGGLSGSVRELLRHLPAQLSSNGRPKDSFWALKDVSFEISQGEVVGFIGRNGAGKSTLLKILSRITDPTAGEVNIYGRIGSILEIGTGFHPDFTGRENILLNGVMLGMSRKQVSEVSDEIAAFAGLDAFIDTPVKYYSSGMFVRLAFSVAAHFEPELLILDEVLAVGDADFQKKCIAKMEEIRDRGSTIILVTHDLLSIGRLCDRAMLFEAGRLIETGEPAAVIDRYVGLIESLPGRAV